MAILGDPPEARLNFTNDYGRIIRLILSVLIAAFPGPSENPSLLSRKWLSLALLVGMFRNRNSGLRLGLRLGLG